MFQTFKTSIRQFFAAVVLLCVAVLVVELILQSRLPGTATTVALTAQASDQRLLVPSATTHHEMLRLHPATQSGFQTNSYGLRGPEPLEKFDGLRILILGDDTIVGTNLRDEETLPSRLQQFLSKSAGTNVEVINAGIPGYCPLLSWIQYHHQLRRLNADIVVLHFDMSDVADDRAYRSILNTSGSQPVCSNPALSQKAKPWPLRLLSESAISRTLLGKGTATEHASGPQNLSRYGWTLKEPTDLRLTIQHALSPLESLRQVVESDGAKLVVASTPVPWQLQTQAKNEAPIGSAAPFQVISAVCAASHTLFCSSANAFDRFADPTKLYVEGTARLSPHGAALYAKQIASMLLSTAETASLFSSNRQLSGAGAVYR